MRTDAERALVASPVPFNRALVLALLAAAVLTADLYSKSKVFHDLGYPGAELRPFVFGTHSLFAHPVGQEGISVPYIDGWMTFRLLTSFNRGALWGVGQEYTWLFAALSLAAVVGIPTWLFTFRAARSLWLTVALAFILGGTLGNLYDRIGLHRCVDANGQPIVAVRDFLLFTFGTFHWPVFNFADVSLVTGAALLAIHSILPARFHAHPAADAAQTARLSVGAEASSAPASVAANVK
jgi:signal peptidase II